MNNVTFTFVSNTRTSISVNTQKEVESSATASDLVCIRGSQIKTDTRHKTHSSQKLATLLLRTDTPIYGVGDMHSENAQVHTVVPLLLWR